MYIHKNKTNQMPHITYFTTTELLFYYLQIESISAIIIIKIVKKKPASTTHQFQTVTVDAVLHVFHLNIFEISGFSLSRFIHNDHFIRFIMSFSLFLCICICICICYISITHAFSVVFTQSLSHSHAHNTLSFIPILSIYLFNSILLKQCDSIRIVYGSAPYSCIPAFTMLSIIYISQLSFNHQPPPDPKINLTVLTCNFVNIF